MPDDVSVFGGIARSGPALSLKELHIQYPVQLIFNSPKAALCFQNLTCRHSFAAVNEIMRLLWDVSILFNFCSTIENFLLTNLRLCGIIQHVPQADEERCPSGLRNRS